LEQGVPGQTYNIGCEQEMRNIDVVLTVCKLLDELRPAKKPYAEQIAYVKDRPGHDRRYAMNIAKIRRELDWQPRETFVTGMRKTVQWYLDSHKWIEHVTSGAYRQWINRQYAGRAGGEAQ
jgi:dTDP-glucose 4,6-dehydratase